MGSLIKTQDDFDEIKWMSAGEGYKDGGIEVKILSNEQVGSGRWYSNHEVVWLENGMLYGYIYDLGLTEYQQGEEEEFDPRGIYEVEPYEVTVTKYRKK